MTRLVIIARTRITDSEVCIGAIDIENDRIVRLHDHNGKNFRQDYPFAVGQVWNARLFPKRSRPPHSEDTHAIQLAREQHAFDIKEYVDRARDRLPIWIGGPRSVFDGKLRISSSSGAAALYRDDELPTGSLGLWIPDNQLIKVRDDRYATRQFYSYVDPSGREQMKFRITGLASNPQAVPAGSIVSLSLARWWQPLDDPSRPEQCTPMICDVLWTPT